MLTAYRTHQEEEHDPQFAPVHQLTEKDQIETKTFEEDEDAQFKMCVDARLIVLLLDSDP